MSARLLPLLLAGILCAALSAGAGAQAPRPLRIIVPFEPGGQVDLMARLVAENLSARVGRTIVVDNRAGASGLIAMQIALAAAADGNTLVLGSASTMALLPHTSAKAPYDPIRDFTAISLISTSPYVLVVASAMPVQSVSDLIRLAKAKPKALTFGSAGHTAGTRISTELFNTMAGIDVVHVAYKGSAPATIALLASQVSFLFNNLLPSLPHIAAGRLRPLGVSSLNRNRALPNVPTISEAGVPGYESGAWNGLVAPHRPQKSVIHALQKDVVAVLATASVKTSINEQGGEVIGSTPDEFTAFIRAENEKWSRVIARIKLE